MYSEKQKMGIRGEKYVNYLLDKLYKAESGFKINHINFKNYSWGYGLDNKIFYKNQPYIGLEIKNFNYTNKQYGVSWVYEDVLPRFKDEKQSFPIKILIISFKDCISETAFKLLKQHNIQVFELGQLITEQHLRRQYHFGKLFYCILSQLKKFVKQAEPNFFGGGLVGLIDTNHMLNNYFSNTSNNLSNTNNQNTDTLLIKERRKIVISFKYSKENIEYCREMALS